MDLDVEGSRRVGLPGDGGRRPTVCTIEADEHEEGVGSRREGPQSAKDSPNKNVFKQ